jgi:hypothetical protein
MECGEELMGMEMNHEWRRWTGGGFVGRRKKGRGVVGLGVTASLWLTSNTCVHYNNYY